MMLQEELWGKIPYALLREKWASKNVLRVYCVLSGHQGGNENCWPSRERIGKCCGIKDVEEIRKSINILVEHGWVQKSFRKEETNQYRVAIAVIDPSGRWEEVESTGRGEVESTGRGEVESTGRGEVESTYQKDHIKYKLKDKKNSDISNELTNKVYDMYKDISKSTINYFRLKAMVKKYLKNDPVNVDTLVTLGLKLKHVSTRRGVEIGQDALDELIFKFGEVTPEEFGRLQKWLFLNQPSWSWWIPKNFFANLTVIREHAKKVSAGSSDLEASREATRKLHEDLEKEMGR